jgi:hypothetical protein
MSDTQDRFDPEKFGVRLSNPIPGPFNFGKLSQSAVALIVDNWPLVLVMSVCLVSLPKLLVVGTHLSFHGRLSDEDPTYDLLNNIDSFLDFVVVILLQFGLTWALVRRKEGADLSFGSLASVVIPSLILAVLSGIGIALGLVFLIIPGLILLVQWSIAGAIVVAEGRTALQAMGRSAELCRGYFWPIWGALILCVIFSTVWEYGIDFIKEQLDNIWPDTHVDWAFESLVTPYGSLPSIAAAIALYFHLVEIKEGGNDTSIAEAFD